MNKLATLIKYKATKKCETTVTFARSLLNVLTLAFALVTKGGERVGPNCNSSKRAFATSLLHNADSCDG